MNVKFCVDDAASRCDQLPNKRYIAHAIGVEVNSSRNGKVGPSVVIDCIRLTGALFIVKPCSWNKGSFEMDAIPVPCRVGVHICKNCIALGREQAIEVGVLRLRVAGDLADNPPGLSVVR